MLRFAVLPPLCTHSTLTGTPTHLHLVRPLLVSLVSDWFLVGRYGISPKTLGRALTMDQDVKAFAVFIASLGDEAERTMNALPPGRGFLCMDSNALPQVTFTAAVAAVATAVDTAHTFTHAHTRSHTHALIHTQPHSHKRDLRLLQ